MHRTKIKQTVTDLQADAHVDAYKVRSIVVVKTDAPVSDWQYMATFGDYDLDYLYGTGATPQEAREDLCAMANVYLPGA